MKYNAGKDNSQWVESPIKSEEVLREELFVNKLSYQKIADKYGVSKRTVARYVKKFNIKIDIKERLSETRNYKGENHPQWKGGRRYKKCPKCGEVDISFVANSCIPCRDISGEKNGMFGKRHTEEAKEAISSKNKGNTHWVNKIHTEESKKKMRLSAIERISTNVYNGGQVKPNYNPKACEVIDEYGLKHGYNFQHALNGGEYHIKDLGYFVDGYDVDKNVVIEYYEKRHNTEKMIKRDNIRREEIINHLGCVFIIIEEGNDGR